MFVAISAVSVPLASLIGSLRPRDDSSYVALLSHDMQLIEGVWCWRDVCPGRDSFDEAGFKLNRWADGQFTSQLTNYVWYLFWTSDDPTLWRVTLWAEPTVNLVQKVWIEPEPQLTRSPFMPTLGSRRLRLGDVIGTFGAPTSVQISRDKAGRSTVCFAANLCAELLATTRLSPFSWIDILYLTMYPLREGTSSMGRVIHWRGWIRFSP